MQDLDQGLIHKYEKILLKAKTHKSVNTESTIFDTAFRKHHENPTTELLAFFINPDEAHNLGQTFYKGFIDTIKSINSDLNLAEFGGFVKIGIEQIVGEQKRIDLWLETDESLILVELKINHIQNNPINHYETWGKNEVRHSKKRLHKLVISKDGKTSFGRNWLGISYTTLAKYMRKSLSKFAIDSALNKWTVFAREFLLHLDNLNEILETDMDKINFLIEHFQDIEELFVLREKAYQEIVQHIMNRYGEEFGNEVYKTQSEQRDKRLAKAWRFRNTRFKNQTDIALYLNFSDKPIAEVWMCFNLTRKNKTLASLLAKEVKKGKFKYLINNKKSEDESDNETFSCYCWEFMDFNLEEITELIIQNQKILDRFELELKMIRQPSAQ